jgi:N-sulfoglucosamine sulfohydrolase
VKPLVFAIAIVISVLTALPAEAAPKNIVLVICDDLGADLGCYGNTAIKTPAIDQLAREGTRFTNAFCTTASCSPSRSVILTGLHNHANAQFGLEHSYHHFRGYETLRSLPLFLKDQAYRTARVGKLHVGPAPVYKFDAEIPGGVRNPVQMADNCREFIAAREPRPFFLYFCPGDPHRGGGVVANNPYKPDRFGNAARGYAGVDEVVYDPASVIVPRFLPDTPTCRAELAQYYQSVSRVDQGIARLVKNLKEAGVYDNTIIVFASDHGIAFPGAKTTLYDPGLRIPLIVRHPDAKVGASGKVSSALVSLVDFTPTLLDMAGIEPGKLADLKLHGRSFLTPLLQANATGFDEVYASHTFHEVTMYYPMRAVRTQQYKLIWNIAHPLSFPFASDLFASPTWQEKFKLGDDAVYGRRTVGNYIHRPRLELYDLLADPDEVKNLADSPAHKEVVAELSAKLKEFQKRTADPWILKWERE